MTSHDPFPVFFNLKKKKIETLADQIDFLRSTSSFGSSSFNRFPRNSLSKSIKISTISIWNPRSNRKNNLFFSRTREYSSVISNYLYLFGKKFRLFGNIIRPTPTDQSNDQLYTIFKINQALLRLFIDRQLGVGLSFFPSKDRILLFPGVWANLQEISFDDRTIHIEEPHEIEVNRYDLSAPMTNRSDHQWIQIGRLLRYNWLYELLPLLK